MLPSSQTITPHSQVSGHQALRRATGSDIGMGWHRLHPGQQVDIAAGAAILVKDDVPGAGPFLYSFETGGTASGPLLYQEVLRQDRHAGSVWRNAAVILAPVLASAAARAAGLLVRLSGPSRTGS